MIVQFPRGRRAARRAETSWLSTRYKLVKLVGAVLIALWLFFIAVAINDWLK
ncbi:MAG: hypothetical protein ACE5JD_12520 [Candidatus Methylomirabilia bacterium]